MSFITFPKPTATVQVFGEGSLSSKICIVGEAPSYQEVNAGRPFVGPAGQLLNDCLHEAKIIRSQCYVTNFIKEKLPPKRGDKNPINEYVTANGRLTAKGLEWQERLADELKGVKSNIIVALGGAATAALCDAWPVSKRRGYITAGHSMFGGRKVIPTYHPASCLYGGNYINRYYITHDLRKADAAADSSELTYDSDSSYSAPGTMSELRAALEPYMTAEKISFDIEVTNFELSCMSFSSDPSYAVVIDLYEHNLWTVEEEVEIMLMVEKILGNPNSIKVGQNLIFDIHFLMSRYNIFTDGPIMDTMVGHSLIYPDFLKGLEFLGSIYTNRRYWKDMLKQKLTKKEG